ncbi:MAG: hypothetical protein A2017_10675 [Lentisphaerae bacterium GWF2_44_16]|nr:MAG: hypothetical protein A2017_10675 [Lentisphaerae bacterium GWF2_44_16]
MPEDKSQNDNSVKLSFPDVKVSESRENENRSSFSFEPVKAENGRENDILSSDFLEEEKKKWENEIKIRHGKTQGVSKKAIMVLVAFAVFFFFLAALFLLFSFGGKTQETKSESPVSAKVKAKPEKEKKPLAEKVPQVNFVEIFPEIKKAVSEKNWTKLSEISLNALKEQPENITLHEKIQNYLMACGFHDRIGKLYDKYASENPASAEAVFLAARLKGNTQSAAHKMQEALKIKPGFYEAYMELGNIFSHLRNWNEAEEAYKGALKLKPDDPAARYLFALEQLRAGKGREALGAYETYLQGRKLTPPQVALKCVWLALHLDTPALAEKYLGEIKKEARYERKYMFYSMAEKAIYGKLEEKDFQEWYPNECRVYHIIYLLSRNKEREVQLQTTPPDDFPDFWKVFLAWKNDNADWQNNASAIIGKNRKDKDRTKGIIASLWLSEISVEDAERRLNDVAPESEGLFYLMLAECCKKKNEPEKAAGYYAKALKAKASPYKALIENYSRKK